MELSSPLSLPPQRDRSHFVAIIIASLRVTLTQMLFSSFFVRHSINDIIAFRLSGGTGLADCILLFSFNFYCETDSNEKRWKQWLFHISLYII